MTYRHDHFSLLVNFLALLLGLCLALLSASSRAQSSQATLESPTAGAFVQSGVGLIRGWACTAQRIEFSIDGGALQAIAYGTDRPDTAATCGDSNNGFGFTQNWGELGDGVHNLRAFADGVAFADVNFTVTTLGRAYLTGLVAQYTLRDFPAAGDEPQVRWSEPQQNFVFARSAAIPANTPPPANPRAALESPTQGSYQSGVELIRGWACEAQRVEFSIDGGALQAIAYGTDRPDTTATCGDSNNGFGFTYNWNRISEGTHNLRAYLDGVEFANVNFAVTTLGAEYLTGLSRQFVFADFPETGQTTTAEWSEPQQNFIVARTTATPSRLALITAITDVLNPMVVAGNGTGAALGESTGVITTKRSSDGVPTQLEGLTWASSPTSQSADLQLADDGLPAVYTDSSGMEARFSDYQLTDAASSVTVSFFRNGAALGNPATVPVEGAGLRALQIMAERVRQAVQGASASTGRQVAPTVTASARQTQDTAVSRFTLSALLVNSYWYGSVAAGDTLCAVRAAADQAGVNGLVAPDACQSPLIAAFLTRAATRRGTAAEPPASGIDPLVQQALQADADVVNAPCGPAGGGVSCLEPVATELQTRQRESAQLPTLPWEEPADTVLPPPTGVDASDGIFTDLIRITWNPVAGATFYEVYRDESFRIGSPTGTSFEDTDIKPGLTYSYAIKACNTDGCGDLSNADSGFAQAQQPVTHLVTATAGSGGTISPSSQTVNAGATTSFTVTPDSGYQIESVTGCDGSLGDTTYTTGPITADCTVSASFSALPPESYSLTLTTTGTGSGTVSGGGDYPAGATVTLTATPDPNSTFAGWSPSPCAASFTMPAQNLTCTATFTTGYSVTTTATSGGTISPSSQLVSYGATASFTVTPYYGYQIDSVTGCDGSLGGGETSSGTYTTGPIIADCTVTATFRLATYLVTTDIVGSGTISPTSQMVEHGATVSFVVTPNSSYRIDSVTGCDGNIDYYSGTYTTGPITAACTVTASFSEFVY